MYRVNLIFALHCFTRGIAGETLDQALSYRDNRETRHFDFRRYELSLRLPGIVDGLMGHKCFHTEHGNYFAVQVVDENGKKTEYEIYFTVSKASKGGTLNLFVQSAYPRDPAYRQNRPQHSKRISFAVILHNTFNKISIRTLK